MDGLWHRALDSVRHEWHEAPWFVLLMICVSALVATIAIPAVLSALGNVF